MKGVGFASRVLRIRKEKNSLMVLLYYSTGVPLGFTVNQ